MASQRAPRHAFKFGQVVIWNWITAVSRTSPSPPSLSGRNGDRMREQGVELRQVVSRPNNEYFTVVGLRREPVRRGAPQTKEPATSERRRPVVQ
jgi:hypothetical protein